MISFYFNLPIRIEALPQDEEDDEQEDDREHSHVKIPT